MYKMPYSRLAILRFGLREVGAMPPQAGITLNIAASGAGENGSMELTSAGVAPFLPPGLVEVAARQA